MIDPRIRHRTLRAGAIRMHCAELGDAGKPLVLFLHGFPECWATWRHQLPATADAGFLAVAPDLRGYGGSDRPQGIGSYRVEALAADMAALIEAYGRERAFVVGHDWGAYVAWHLAMLSPARVERLAILNVPHPQRFLRALRTLRQLRKSSYIFFYQLPWLPERLIARDDFALVRKLLRTTPARPGAYDDEDIEAIVSALRPPGALTAALDYYRAAARRLPPRWQAIRAPVLVIWGERDRWLGAELATPDPRWVPRCRVERLPEATHWVQADEPQRVTELLLSFASEG